MSLYKETEGIVDGVNVKVIVPGKLIQELARLLGEEGDVSVYLGENQAAFEFDSMRLTAALIEGSFPNYEMVVPQKHDKQAKVGTGSLLEAVRRTRTMTNEKFNSVRLKLDSGSAKLSVVTPEVGEYEEDFAVDYKGGPIEIAFNPDFLLDILKHIGTETCTLVLKDAMSPGIVKPTIDGGADKYINVVMPIRIS